MNNCSADIFFVCGFWRLSTVASPNIELESCATGELETL